MFFPAACLSLAAAYAGIMLWYRYHWRRIPDWSPSAESVPCTPVTVVMAARNEAENIGACLESILSGSYPPHLTEIIVVDDHSEDETADIAARFPGVLVIRLADQSAPMPASSPKKRALELALAHAGGRLVVTTDADCIAGPNWLRSLALYYEQGGARLLAAPVSFHREKNLFERFQSLDFIGLMGITGAGIQSRKQRMGNGANLAYEKSLFEEVGGYGGSEHRASGDDMFLIQKAAAQNPEWVCFIKSRDALVYTRAMPSLGDFVQQRLRWGAKNAALPEWPIRLILALVWLFCLFLLLGLPWAWLSAKGLSGAAAWVTLALGIKALFDYIFLREMCRWFHRRDLMAYFWPSFLMHTLYIALIGLASILVKRYRWKGRVLK